MDRSRFPRKADGFFRGIRAVCLDVTHLQTGTFWDILGHLMESCASDSTTCQDNRVPPEASLRLGRFPLRHHIRALCAIAPGLRIA